MNGSKAEVRPGVWRLRVFTGRRRPNGTPIQISKTVYAPEAIPGSKRLPKPGAGVRLADEELAKMIAKVISGSVVTGNETVSQLIDLWLEHCESIGRSPTTLRKYRSIAETVVKPELGKIRLTKLSARDLDRLYSKLTAKGNKPATVRRVHALIGAALHQAERWDMVDTNIARRARPPTAHTERVKVPTPAEVQRIIGAAEEVEPGLATMLLVAALTGARRGELCALRWPDVDWVGRTLNVGRSVYETTGGGWGEKPTKTHQVRRIGLDELGIEALHRHRASVDHLASHLDLNVREDGFIFSRSPVGAEPIRPDVVTKFTIRMAKKAEVDTHLHAFRHFSATQGIAAGFDPVTVGARLGHADSSITLRVYAHALQERDRELAAVLGRKLLLRH